MGSHEWHAGDRAVWQLNVHKKRAVGVPVVVLAVLDKRVKVETRRGNGWTESQHNVRPTMLHKPEEWTER